MAQTRKKEKRMLQTRNIMDEPIEEINVPVMRPIPYDPRRGKPPFIRIRRNFVRFADEMMTYVPRPMRRRVNRRIGRLRREIRNIYQRYGRLQLYQREAPLHGFLRTDRINGERGYDQRTFTQYIRPRVIEFLTEEKKKKKPLKMKIVFTCKFKKGNDTNYGYFHTDIKKITADDDLGEIYNLLIAEILAKIDKFQNKGSGWQFEQVVSFDIDVDPYRPIRGRSYIKTPRELSGKHAIINVKNERDNMCFKWAVTSAVFPRKKDPQRLDDEMRRNSVRLNWDGIDFPTPLSQINQFEKQNPYSINVYEWDGKNTDILRISKHENEQCINLILITNGGNKHYCWIKNMSALFSKQINNHGKKRYFCKYCCNSFQEEETLKRHLEYCSKREAVKVKMPEKGTMLYFKNFYKKMRLPFVVYADFEACTEGISTCHPDDNESYTNQYQKHTPCYFCYYIKCVDDDVFPPLLRHYTIGKQDENVGKIFVKKLERYIKEIYQKFKFKKDMRITQAQEREFQSETVCHICEKLLNGEKVRDHCHLTGRYRGAAHNHCKLCFKLPKFYPVIFHNLSGYDTHMFIKDLAETPGEINCISKTEENYISFSKMIVVDTFEERVEARENCFEFGHTVNNIKVKRQIRFIDSFKFMTSSLAELAGNLSQHCNLERHFEGKQLELVKRKGVYPYDYMSSFERLGETCLPPIECFYSKLNDKGISTEDYAHARLVWDIFEMKTMRDYHDLYLKTDVLLLADVFEEFRNVCLKHYKLDPAWYYTAPGLAWDACLKMTQVELELLHDQDVLLMVEEGIRGGVSMISTRYGKANNKYMKEAEDPKDPKEPKDGEYNPNLPSKYIAFLDANNLYGWAMSKKLPTHGFRWMTPWQLENWRYHTCILEVDLEYPLDLHDPHNDYPLAPDHLEMGGVEKLIPNFHKKEKYVVHYEALKTYVKYGIKISKIHRGVVFHDSPWMKPYIDKNTKLRMQ